MISHIMSNNISTGGSERIAHFLGGARRMKCSTGGGDSNTHKIAIISLKK